MSCPLKNIKLDPVASGETWGGLTFTINSSDDTAYAAALVTASAVGTVTGSVAAVAAANLAR